jgi:8-oxo-dGTP pyrophosphatase MutT (NUDIX family)
MSAEQGGGQAGRPGDTEKGGAEKGGAAAGGGPRKDAVRDAATVILVRRDGDAPRVLMGQRGRKAAFMPSKFVFPGGAIDPQDREVVPARALPGHELERLARRADPALGPVLALTAIRELWEEAGLALGVPEGPVPPAAPSEWESFYAAGHRPNAEALRFVFRAITPPGRPRRFDARFFVADAAALAGDPDDFGLAADELSHLSWLTVGEARGLDLPFITEVVLAEVEARLRAPDMARPVPFFYHQDGKSFVDQL